MKFKFLTALVLVAVFVCPLMGEPISVGGRQTAQPGDLVVLRAEVPEGTQHLWVWDRLAYDFDAIECGDDASLAFSAARPGRYVFWLVTTSADGLEYDQHVVTVGAGGGGVITPPPDNGGTDGPTNPPVVDDRAEARAAAMASINQRYPLYMQKLNDAITAQQLAAVWAAASAQISGADTTTAAGELAGALYGEVMTNRTGLSRYADWVAGFRAHFSDDVTTWAEAGLITTPAEYNTFVQAVAGAINPAP